MQRPRCSEKCPSDVLADLFFSQTCIDDEPVHICIFLGHFVFLLFVGRLNWLHNGHELSRALTRYDDSQAKALDSVADHQPRAGRLGPQ